MSHGVQHGPQRIVLYGPAGSGKSTACANAQKIGIKPLFLDLDNGSGELDVARIDPTPETFDEVRQILHGQALQGDHDMFVIDSFTRLERLIDRWVLENKKDSNGRYVSSIEGFGFGKGYTYIFEAFLLVLGDLDAIIRAGKHVVGVCHNCTAEVPNPDGETYIRYEPRLQQPAKIAQLRCQVIEWCGHLLFLDFDIAVNEKGKAVGGGTRTIYPEPRPSHLAKSHILSEPIVCEHDSAEIWNLLLKGE